MQEFVVKEHSRDTSEISRITCVSIPMFSERLLSGSTGELMITSEEIDELIVVIQRTL